MIVGDFVVGLVFVVLCLRYHVLRRMYLVMWLILCYILGFVRLKVFYLLMMKIFQKILQIICVLRLLGGLLECV